MTKASRFNYLPLTLCALLLALMACTPAIAAQTQTQAIKNLITQYETQLNASNADAILTLYSSKPIFMPQHSSAQVGRAAVASAYQAVFNAIKLDIKFTIYEVVVTGNSAWARTSSSGQTTILAKNVTIAEGNNELFIFKKENGKWKIHRYLFSTSTARQP